jgi:CHAT domain-containing protein/Tfp pilus assembly protein PilF
MLPSPARRGTALVLTVFACSIAVVARDDQAGTDAPLALRAGAVHERALAGGGAHTYEVRLQREQYLHAVVTANGLNVGVSLVPPEGDPIEVNLLGDQIGDENVLAIATTDGVHRLVVKSMNAKAPAGRYALRVSALRPATAEDDVRVRARRALEAAHALTRGEPSQWKQADPGFIEARALFASIGDARGEAEAVYQLALNARDLNNPAALDLTRDALGRFRALEDEPYVGRALKALADVHQRRGDLDDSIQVAHEALAIHRRVGNPEQEAGVLVGLGITHGRRGEPEQAVAYFQEAAQITERLAVNNWMVFNNLAIATKDLGDFKLSLRYYDQALQRARASGSRDLEAAVLTNMGNLHRSLGEYRQALVLYEASLPLAVASGSQEVEARVLNTMGSTLYRLGEYERALALHERSLAIRRSIVDVAAEAASLNGAGLALHALGRSDEALSRLDEALVIRRRTSDRLGEANTLHDLALVARDRGDLAAARAHLEAAIAVTDLLRGQIMSPDLRASFIAAEHDRYELYIDVLMQMHAARPADRLDLVALEVSERGRARVLRESLLEARADIRQGVPPALLDEERAVQREIQAASTSLSRLLSRASEASAVNAARASLATATSRQADLLARIRRESPAYAALTQPDSPAVTDLQRDAVDEQTLLLEFSLGEERSWLWAVSPGEVLSVELAPRREIEARARRVYEALTARQPRAGETPAARTARVTRADQDLVRESRALSRLILLPIAEKIGPAWRDRRLLIVADGMLQFVPFAALPDPMDQGQALMVTHEIASLPSAAVLSAIRAHAAVQPRASQSIAIVADPVFEADDPRLTDPLKAVARAAQSTVRGTDDTPGVSVEARALRSLDGIDQSRPARLTRLPFTRQEARAIATLAPQQPFQVTDFGATRHVVLGPELSSYRYVHLATHGIFNSEQPDLSGLVFSLLDQQGKAVDGFLRLNDIYNMRLSADVVVLSACQTALGADVRGEGLVGLTRGFMYAGARRVVASLWQVDDRSTVELMRHFYAGMMREGLSPAAALRRAQREMARDPRWSSPFFWAPFVLQGEWR